jgi:hypothetical protein
MAILFYLLVSFAHAQMAPVLWSAGQIGASQATVEKRLSTAGYAIHSVSWDKPGGLAAGTLGPPGLLALMNQHKIPNRLLDGLPKKGPTFIMVEHESAFAVYAFLHNRLWAAAFGLTHTAIKPKPDPFDSTRLDGLAKTMSAIRSKCGGLSIMKRDSYGNARAWKSSCQGGRIFAHYEPDQAVPLRILLVGPKR